MSRSSVRSASVLEVKGVYARVERSDPPSLDALAAAVEAAARRATQELGERWREWQPDVYDGAVHCDEKCNYDPRHAAEFLRFLQQVSRSLDDERLLIELETLTTPVLLVRGEFSPAIEAAVEQALADPAEGSVQVHKAAGTTRSSFIQASADVRALLVHDEVWWGDVHVRGTFHGPVVEISLTDGNQLVWPQRRGFDPDELAPPPPRFVTGPRSRWAGPEVIDAMPAGDVVALITRDERSDATFRFATFDPMGTVRRTTLWVRGKDGTTALMKDTPPAWTWLRWVQGSRDPL